MKGLICKNSDPLYRKEVELETMSGLHELYKGEGHNDLMINFDVARGADFKVYVCDVFDEHLDQVNPKLLDQEVPDLPPKAVVTTGSGLVELYFEGLQNGQNGMAFDIEQAIVLIEAIEQAIDEIVDEGEE